MADALGNVIRAAARLSRIQRRGCGGAGPYATRRGLLGQEEGDRLLAEVHAAEQRRLDKAADREKALKAKARAKGKTVRPVKAVKNGQEGGEGQAASGSLPPQVLKSCISAVSRVAPWSRSPAAAAISSVLALCSSAAAVTSSLAEACSVAA